MSTPACSASSACGRAAPVRRGFGSTFFLGSGAAAKCKGSSEEYKAMKSKLLEKEAATPPCDPVEASVRRVCMAALRKENEQLKEENAHACVRTLLHLRKNARPACTG